MDKSDSAYKTIGEVAKILNLIDKKTGKVTEPPVKVTKVDPKSLKNNPTGARIPKPKKVVKKTVAKQTSAAAADAFVFITCEPTLDNTPTSRTITITITLDNTSSSAARCCTHSRRWPPLHACWFTRYFFHHQPPLARTIPSFIFAAHLKSATCQRTA